MDRKTNVGIVAKGEMFGFPTECCIINENGEMVITGSLSTKGKAVSDLIQNEGLKLDGVADKLTVIKSINEFTVDFIKKSSDFYLLLSSTGISCGIIIAGQNKQLILFLDTNKLKGGNDFERFVCEIAEWAGIHHLFLAAKNQGSFNDLSLLKILSDKMDLRSYVPDSYLNYELIAAGMFDLNNNAFGQFVKQLTGQSFLKFAVGGSFTDKSFAAELSSEKIEAEHFTIENLSFGIQKIDERICCETSGKFIFRLDNLDFGFTLSGMVSNSSFSLSAASLPDMRLPLNSRLSFSDLALDINVGATGVSFGMTGRINTNNMSLFGGFVVAPPRISLLTAAITSSSGRVSLRDLVVEVADIRCDSVECLDMIAVEDFDINDVTLFNGKGLSEYPTDRRDVNFTEKKKKIESAVIVDFNSHINGNELKINGDAQLTPLGNTNDQFILTDKGNMRHYRIDRTGKVSLNCQIYVCSQPVVLGGMPMPLGFFICGTLDIFKVKARFLFMVEKGKSLVALVQIREINIANIFILRASSHQLNIEPIQGGFAGQLVKSDANGAIMYLNIQKERNELTFYLNAQISILKIFNLDTLVLIKDKQVYVNIQYKLWGFSVTFNLSGSYDKLVNSQGGFSVLVTFDTSDFLDAVNSVSNQLRDTARKVTESIDSATRRIDDAQRNVLSLQSQINDFNNRIDQCRSDIHHAKWYKIGLKIARAAEIGWIEIKKAGVYVAIGVAYSALEIAKAALRLDGAIVSGILNSLATVVNAVTKLLWINSFSIGLIDASPNNQRLIASLSLTVLGKEIKLDDSFEFNGDVRQSINNFVHKKLSDEAERLINDIKGGKRAYLPDGVNEEFDQNFIAEYCNLDKNKEKFVQMSDMSNAIDDLFIDANNAYFDAYNEEDTDARAAACELTNLRWENDNFKSQHTMDFDDEFVQSLNQVVGTIRNEKANNRASVSDDAEKMMDSLLDTVNIIREDNRSKANHDSNGESLFSRLEKNIDVKRSSRRSRAENDQIGIDAANDNYAKSVSLLVERHLGDHKCEEAEAMKKTIGIALYQFRNPDDTFRKGSNDVNNEHDEDDL